MLRFRHSSSKELLHRFRQSAALFFLRLLARLDSPLLIPPAIDAGEIERIRLPDLTPEDKHGFLQGHGANHLQNLLHSLPSDPRAAETDIRMRWEPARLQRVTTLILHAHLSASADEGRRAQEAARDQILDWIHSNPFLEGEHYLSAMECALRVPVFVYALKRLDCLAERDSDLFLKAIYCHALLIANQLSLHSSLGNHTIAEAVGLVFAGAIFNTSRHGRRWLQTGIGLLTSELPHQILDDGGPAEQSLSYHRFVLDLYWLVLDFIQKNNLGDVQAWKPRLMRGESFLSVFADQGTNFPSIGDSDDGFAVAPGIKPARYSGTVIDRNWVSFKDSGYSIINDGDLVFSFDHGPLGMAPLYNHGHADALSITLSKANRPFLVDCGTYRYNGVPAWRRYFKSTCAHNTVTIDNLDQSTQETGFIWSQPYHTNQTAGQADDSNIFCSAVHDGYTRLSGPVRHRRSVLFFDCSNFIIRDRFSGRGRHRFQLNYHLHPDVVLEKKGSWWVLDNRGVLLFMKLLKGDFQVVSGSHNPIMGWFSSCYGEKMPTIVLTHFKTGYTEDIVFTTAIFTRSPF